MRTSLQASLKLPGSLLDGPVLEEGHVLFSVEADRALAICTCLSGMSYVILVAPFLTNIAEARLLIGMCLSG